MESGLSDSAGVADAKMMRRRRAQAGAVAAAAAGPGRAPAARPGLPGWGGP
jgi:hypothetical protein